MKHCSKTDAVCVAEVTGIRSWKDICADMSTDKLTKSLLSVVMIVAEHILNQKAVLLPQISQIFLEIHGIPPTGAANLEVGNTNIQV